MNKGLKNCIDSVKVARKPKNTDKYFESVWTYIKNTFILGKVQVDCRYGDGFRWTDGFGNYEIFIKLTDIISDMILTDKNAEEYLNTIKFDFKNIEKTAPLVLFVPSPFILIFPHKSDGASFIKYLSKSLDLYRSQAHNEEARLDVPGSNYGAIFDISELTSEADDLKEFQVTFINDDASHIESFAFDKTQGNMYKTADILAGTLRPVLDSPNIEIFYSFLADLIRTESLDRVGSLESIKTLQRFAPATFELSRKENSYLRNSYLTINPKKIEKQGLDLLEKTQRYAKNDPLGKALNCIYLQKLQISAELCEIASVHGDMRRRKSFDSITEIKAQEVRERSPPKRQKMSKSPVRPSRRRESRLNRDEPQKKSFFRNACDCMII